LLFLYPEIWINVLSRRVKNNDILGRVTNKLNDANLTVEEELFLISLNSQDSLKKRIIETPKELESYSSTVDINLFWDNVTRKSTPFGKSKPVLIVTLNIRLVQRKNFITHLIIFFLNHFILI
jgi:hypothetical protein